MNVKNEIISSLKATIKDLAFQGEVPSGTSQGLAWEASKLVLQTPKDESHGDYASNIAMVIFSNSKFKIQNSKFRTPLELAQKIAERLNSSRSTLANIDKVEAVKPGFINFHLSKEYLISQLTLISNKTPLRSSSFAGRRIMVEFTDPNPFKEFHIGHLYSNTVGESISRLLEALGANVKRANYQGDVGMHIAKSLYSILQISNLKSRAAGKASSDARQISNLEKRPAKERAEFLGKCYAMGAKAYEVSEKAKKEIEQLNKKIYGKDPELTELYEKGRQWSLEYFEEIYKRLGTKFNYYYFESEVGKDGAELVREYLKKGVFEESQGAIIFPGEKYKLHNRVFINSLGLPTYEAKELGLAPKKFRDFNYDKSIVITGNEVIGYFKVILAALGKINPDLAAKTKHLAHGMVKLPTGKMSSRTGNVLTAEWILDEAKKHLKSKYSEMTDDTLEKVAVGSVKYGLLKSSIGHDIEFDFEESINIQGNSGPYLQYTFARTQSVLTKSQISNLKSQINFKFEPEEIVLLRAIHRFPEVVEEAGEKFAPNLLCNYLFDLAQKFNLFYQRHKIIGSKNQEFRLALTNAVGIIIKSGLNLLGVQAPTKM